MTDAGSAERARSTGITGMDADAVVAELRLSPHPEGGYYRRTWADGAGSAIYFLLRLGQPSKWHRVLDRAEVWHFYLGASLELEVDEQSPGGPSTARIRLGPRLTAGDRPQVVVPSGAWQRARTLGDWTLAGCTVAPPFSFDAFELG